MVHKLTTEPKTADPAHPFLFASSHERVWLPSKSDDIH